MSALCPPVFDVPLEWSPGGVRLDVVHRVRDPGVQGVGLELCDAMASWKQGRSGRPPAGLIQRALACDSQILSPFAAIALGEAFGQEPESLMAVFRAAPAKARALVLRWVRGTASIPREAMTRLVAEGLADRSQRVQFFAVETAECLDLTELLPALRALGTGPLTGLLATFLPRAIKMLETGFTATRTGDSYIVEFRRDAALHLPSVEVPAHVVEARGIDAAVAHARARLERRVDDFDWPGFCRSTTAD